VLSLTLLRLRWLMVNITLFLCDPALILDPHAIAWPTTRHKLATPLETVIDGLSDAVHRRQDEKVLKIVTKITSDPFPSPIILLTTIVQFSEGLLDPNYKEFSEASGLIEAHPQLAQHLEAAWQAKSFRNIRNLSATFN
jgi:hypothetical protein